MSDGQIGDPFTCSICQGTFLRAWSDEEARENYRRRWGTPVGDEPLRIVCPDCDALFLEWYKWYRGQAN